LGSHIVHSYDEQLEHITRLVVEMGLLVRDLVRIAEESMQEHAADFVALAKATDKKVNHLDNEIEKQATAILALRQPMAIDLRLSISVLKIAVIMERMGDLAKNTVKRASKMHIPPSAHATGQITTMSNIIIEMLEESLAAFQERNVEKAQAVMLRDGEVDNIYHQLMAELQDAMIEKPEAIPSIMQVIFAVKNIERIGDYVSKTANIVHYIVSGKKLAKPLKGPKLPDAADIV
jgi:phosphate transport system protein